MNSSRPCGPANPALIPELGARARNGRVLFQPGMATSAPPSHRRGFREGSGAHGAGLRTDVSADASGTAGKEVKKTTFPVEEPLRSDRRYQTALAQVFYGIAVCPTLDFWEIVLTTFFPRGFQKSDVQSPSSTYPQTTIHMIFYKKLFLEISVCFQQQISLATKSMIWVQITTAVALLVSV